MIYICYMDCRNTFVLSPGSLPAYCGDTSGAKISHTHKQCSSLQLYSQAWVVNLHVRMPSFHSHCLNIVFLSTRTPSFPLTSSHTHICAACMEDKHIHVILYLQDKKENSYHPITCRFSHLTVKFWVSWAGRSSHPSWLLTHVKNEKRDRRDFHIKGWRAHLRLLKRL